LNRQVESKNGIPNGCRFFDEYSKFPSTYPQRFCESDQLISPDAASKYAKPYERISIKPGTRVENPSEIMMFTKELA
jgi:hypothetical protein